MQILRLKQVIQKTGLSRSSIYLRIQDKDSDFPKPISLGGRSIGWVEQEVDDYIENQVNARNSNLESN